MDTSDSAWPERIDPLNTSPGVVAHHLKKYDFALRYARGRILDVACGVGYGTALLSGAARHTVGLEIAEDALATARHRYAGSITSFVRGNAERLPFRDDTFELVTCFEGIEHFESPEHHLDEIARVLGAGGAYIVSTPNPLTNPHDDENPYHLHQFAASRLLGLLQERFADVEMFGQFREQSTAHRATQRIDVLGLRRAAFLRPLARRVSRTWLKTAPTEEATLADFSIRPFAPEASEYVAVCVADHESARDL